MSLLDLEWVFPILKHTNYAIQLTPLKIFLVLCVSVVWMKSHRSFKVKIVATSILSGLEKTTNLTILNDTEHMTSVARYIYHSLKLRTQQQQNYILRLNLLCFSFRLVFYYLQTPYPMSTCLFSYIHTGFNLQTLPSTFLCILVCIVLFNVCRDRNIDRIFVAFRTQFVMLHKLTELSLSIHMQLYFCFLVFLILCRRCLVLQIHVAQESGE